MWLISLILQIVFGLFMLGIILAFLFSLLITWAWAQQRENSLGIAELISTAAIEWGAFVTLGLGHLVSTERFHEAPPIKRSGSQIWEFNRQLPIVFIPSLHTGPNLFLMVMWRLKSNFFTSLWPFSWKSFLVSSALLEDQLSDYLEKLLIKTDSPKLRIVSLGSSYPIVSRVLSAEKFADRCDKWIALSSAITPSGTMKFLSTPRIRNAYATPAGKRQADFLLRGSHDCFCYPDSVWPAVKTKLVPDMGHYSVLLHSTTVQTLLEEFR